MRRALGATLVAKRPPLSRAETEIARLVWQAGGATVREVVELLPADRTLDYKTVQTYLRRMQAKGYVRAMREGRSIRYRPAVRPGSVIRETIAEFVDRLFDGEALPLVEHLIRDRRLRPDEIDRLRKLVSEAQEKRRDD